MTDPRSQAVALAERYADGQASPSEVADAQVGAHEAHLEANERDVAVADAGGQAEETFAAARAAELAVQVSDGNVEVVCGVAMTALDAGLLTAGQIRDRIHEVFRNPFLPTALGPALCTTDVLALAEAAYQERLMPSGALAPQHLAVLADALEEAGADPRLLAHLRGPGPHVRGCFAVDAALGRE
jgi:hypothetical protein